MPKHGGILLPVLLAAHVYSLSACLESGYCSLGAVKPFYGSVYSGTGLLRRHVICTC